MSKPSAMRGVLYTGILAALVAATGAVALKGDASEPESAFAANSTAALAPTIDAAASDAPTSEAEASPSDDVLHLTAASRGEVRSSLLDGEGVSFTVVVDGEERNRGGRRHPG